MTHLHLHTNYSFMAGTLSVKQCIGKAVELQLPALAITDTNNLTGAIEFYVEAKKAGIAPIIGVELRTEKEQAVVLAKDYAGYVTLCEIVTKLCEEYPAARTIVREEESSFYPRHPFGDSAQDADGEYIRNPKTGIAYRQGSAPDTHILIPNPESLTPALSSLLLSFDTSHTVILSSIPSLLAALAEQGREDVYIELVRAKDKEWGELRRIAREHRLPIVATNDAYFGYRKEHGLHAILRAIGTNTTVGTLPPQVFTTRDAWVIV